MAEFFRVLKRHFFNIWNEKPLRPTRCLLFIVTVLVRMFWNVFFRNTITGMSMSEGRTYCCTLSLQHRALLKIQGVEYSAYLSKPHGIILINGKILKGKESQAKEAG